MGCLLPPARLQLPTARLPLPTAAGARPRLLVSGPGAGSAARKLISDLRAESVARQRHMSARQRHRRPATASGARPRDQRSTSSASRRCLRVRGWRRVRGRRKEWRPGAGQRVGSRRRHQAERRKRGQRSGPHRAHSVPRRWCSWARCGWPQTQSASSAFIVSPTVRRPESYGDRAGGSGGRHPIRQLLPGGSTYPPARAASRYVLGTAITEYRSDFSDIYFLSGPGTFALVRAFSCREARPSRPHPPVRYCR